MLNLDGDKKPNSEEKKEEPKAEKAEEDKGEEETSEDKKPEPLMKPDSNRKLKGIMRVGALAKGLLLKGQLNVELVVICAGLDNLYLHISAAFEFVTDVVWIFFFQFTQWFKL